jgi:hypothetical protein
MSFKEFLEDISRNSKPIDDIPTLAAKIERILAGKSIIEDEFELLGSGSYKEAYALNDDFVIKFASHYNDTCEEKRLYNLAIDECVDEIFLETYFYDIPEGQYPTLLYLEECSVSESYAREREDLYEVRDDGDRDYDTIHPKADSIIIQAYAEFTVADRSYENFKYNKLDYAKNPIINKADGSEVAHEEARKFSVSSKDWLQAILDIYGIDTFLSMADFFDKYNVSDLHSENIGYIVKNGIEFPVVLDWMSDI